MIAAETSVHNLLNRGSFQLQLGIEVVCRVPG